MIRNNSHNIVKYTFLVLFIVLLRVDAYGQNTSIQSGIVKAKPFPNAAVTLTESWIKHREDLNTNYIKSLEPDRLLHNFKVNANLPSDAIPLDGWEAPWIGLRGHFTGHYLSAVSVLVEKYQDTLLSNRLNYMIDELYKCQQALGNGYLSAFSEKDFDILETQFGGVWAPYYTYNKIMQGLLDAYLHTGNKKAFEMAQNMASYVQMRMDKLDKETINKIIYTPSANPGNEAGAMNEVLYVLYQTTKNPEHLALAELFDPDWFLNPIAENKNILSGLHSNTHIVLVNGFAQRYTISQDEKYYNAVSNFWNMLMNEHVYVNGSSSGPRPNTVTPTSLKAEHWGVPGQLSNTMIGEIAESCVSHNTQKLSSSLFSWTANPLYADAFMNTFYNSIMALQSAHTGKCVYHLPLGSPRKKAFLNENDFRCCNGSTIEAFTQLNSGIYYHSESTFWVNLYVPSKVSWAEKNIVLEQTGSFPTESNVEFKLSTDKKSEFEIKLFVPTWANKIEVIINDEKQNINAKPGSYLSLNRKWKDKDKIRLNFTYDFYYKTMPDDKNVIALFYGPILLAFENGGEIILKGDHDTIIKNLTRVEGNKLFELKNDNNTFKLIPLYDIENQSYGVYGTIRNY